MKFCFFITIFIAGPLYAYAQPNTFCNVSISVTDPRAESIGVATVILRDTVSSKSVTVKTNLSGRVNLRLPKHRVYEVYSTREDYKPGRKRYLTTNADAKKLRLVNHIIMETELETPPDHPEK